MANSADRSSLAIVGGGPAGLAAAIYAARAGLGTTLFEAALPGGQIALTAQVENYPGMPYVVGADLGLAMRTHAEEAGARVVGDEVDLLDLQGNGTFVLRTAGGLRHEASTVVLATGARPRRAGFEGERRFTGHGVSYCATCDAPLFKNKQVFVIGGGTAACEEAEHLARFADRVVLVVRGTRLSCPPRLRTHLVRNPRIHVRFGSRVVRVEGGTRGLSAVYCESDRGDTWHIRGAEGSVGVFVFVGYEPNASLAAGLAALAPDGSVVTDDAMRTGTPGLFAAGDVRRTELRQVLTAASDGAVAATGALRYLETVPRARLI